MRRLNSDKKQNESPEAGEKDPFGSIVFETGVNASHGLDMNEATFSAPHAPSLRSSSIRRPSQYSLAAIARKSSIAAPLTSAPPVVEYSQSHPTALPNEFLSLIRTFRHTIESATGSASPAQQDELRDLQHVCSDIVRFVTSFLIQKYEEQNDYERKKLLGWSGAPPAGQNIGCEGGADPSGKSLATSEGSALPGSRKNTNAAGSTVLSPRSKSLASGPEVLGPFLLSSLYVVAESLLHLLKCDRCLIFLPDDGSKLKSVVSVGCATISAPLFYDFSNGAFGVVFSSGVAVNIADAERAPPQLFSRHTDELSKRGYHVRNLLCFPLVLPLDEPTAVGPPKIRGVIVAVNKVKNSVFPTGFTPEDEEAMHQYALLIATILRWSNSKVEFCSNTAQEESSRLQQLILHNRFVDPLATRRTTGGVNTQTRLEANMKVRRQVQVEAAKEQRDEDALIVQHPVMRMAFRASGIQRTRIYRTPTASSEDDVEAGRGSSSKPVGGTGNSSDGTPQSFILSEASQVVTLGGNVRELLLMLEQADTSWKTSRQECVALQERVAALEASLQIERKRRFEAEEMCRSCGILLPTPKADEEAIRLAAKPTDEVFDGLHDRPSETSTTGARQKEAPIGTGSPSYAGDVGSRSQPGGDSYEEVAKRIAMAQKQQYTYDKNVLAELARLEKGVGLLLDRPDFRPGCGADPSSRPATTSSRTHIAPTFSSSARTAGLQPVHSTNNQQQPAAVSAASVKALIQTLKSHSVPASPVVVANSAAKGKQR